MKCNMKLLIHSQNINGASLRKDKYFHPTFYWLCNYSDLLELKLKLIRVSKMDPWCSLTILRGYKQNGCILTQGRMSSAWSRLLPNSRPKCTVVCHHVSSLSLALGVFPNKKKNLMIKGKEMLRYIRGRGGLFAKMYWKIQQKSS